MAHVAVSPPGAAVGDGLPAALERPDFQIVPRAGLPIVAVVLGLLIAGIAVNKLWPLEFLHVVGGAAWTVIDLFLGFVLGPIIGRLSIPARVEFTTRLMPKMVLIMPTVVTVERQGTFLRCRANASVLGELLGFFYSECCTRNTVIDARELVSQFR
jgi:hypothetical protein